MINWNPATVIRQLVFGVVHKDYERANSDVIWCYLTNLDAWHRRYWAACWIVRSRCTLAWPFKPNLVIHSLPSGPQVPFSSRAWPALLLASLQSGESRPQSPHAAAHTVCKGTDASAWIKFWLFFCFLVSVLLSPTALLPSLLQT